MRALVVSLWLVTNLAAQEPPDLPAAVATPLQDDATLHDVAFVGSRFGWAVGDRGVVWRTTDGGGSWSLVPTPVDVPLRGVSFLTDRIGWIAGGEAVPFSSASAGVLLFTRDGGETWEQLGEHVLPRLFGVRFFGLEQGVVIGTATAENPSGVFTTTDGGQSWHPVVSNDMEEWRAVAFSGPGVGVLTGTKGRVALYAEGRLLASRIANLGLRTVHAVTLERDDRGWLAGDGGLLLRTESGGVAWQQSTTPLPPDVSRLFDFRAVAARGEHVWVAGSPGSVVWHSPDAGRTWQPGRTGQTTPIRSLHFSSETNGVAVGAFGTILRTADGGTTWLAVQGGRRRAAVLAIHAHPQRVSFRMLARESGERGYRSAVLVAARHDVGPDADPVLDGDQRLDEAVVTAGAATAETGWELPLDLPNLDMDSARLLAEWNRRTEGKLEASLVGRLAVAIRTWRPSVIVVDEPPPNDEATKLVHVAVRRAIEQAADGTRDLAQVEIAGLAPWRVDRVLARLPDGSTGNVMLEAYESLPRTGTSLLAAASRAENLFVAESRARPRAEAFRPWDDTGTGPDVIATASDFFTGLALPPGGDARRAQPPFDEARAERDRTLLERQRNLHAYAAGMFDDERKAAGMLAELDPLFRGMSDAQVAEMLLAIAREHRRRSQWELAEAAFVELLRRHPDEPAGREAARWLFQLWTSTETAWQRSRGLGTDVRRTTTNRDAVIAGLSQSIQLASHELAMARDPTQPVPGTTGPDPWTEFQRPSRLVNSGTNTLANGRVDGDDWRAGTVLHWQRRAAWVASLLRERSPETFRSPEIQFPLATLYRQREAFGRADEIHRRFQMTSGTVDDEGLPAVGSAHGGVAASGSGWQTAAATEVWMLQPTALPPKKIAVCRRAAERPHLDGELADACWRTAKVVPLADRDFDEAELAPGNGAYAQFAYDDEYLYLAASVPRDPRLPADEPSLAGRSHDADLTAFDRLSLQLDVDRDYVTFYDLEIDQRGWTRDACWGDRSWNPRWHVAAKSVDGRWNVEVAIPFEELVPRAPLHGHVWAVGLVRTKPAIGVESWTAPPSSRPRPETFGLLRFE